MFVPFVYMTLLIFLIFFLKTKLESHIFHLSWIDGEIVGNE